MLPTSSTKTDLQEDFHLQRLANGDKASFVFFHRKYQSKVYFYCYRFVRSHEVAEEITSDVFVKIWEKREGLRLDLSINGLLFKIAKDYVLSYLRRVARSEDLRKAFVAQFFERSISPVEEHLFFKEDLAIAQQGIDQLPPRCRQVFCLRYAEGHSLQEIAEKLQISINTVQNHLQKGNSLVKRYLREHSDLVFALLICQCQSW